MNINATSLTMMNIALDNGWIGARFYLKAGNSVVVNVIFLEIALVKCCVHLINQ